MNAQYAKISIANRNCPICGNNKDNRILWQTREILPREIMLPEEVTVVSCNNCGFCYSDTPATMKQYDDYYENSNIYGGRSQKNAMALEEELLALTYTLFRRYDKILDMGSGGGDFLRKLKEVGYLNLCGMDVAKENVDILNTFSIKADIAGAYTPVKDTYKAAFDGVFLNAVLEHLLFPKTAIHNMREYLKVNGRMVIVVPDMKLVGEGNSHPSHHFHHEHINYFSILSLDRLMQNEGFSRIYYKEIMEQNDLEKLMVTVYEKSMKVKDEKIVDTVSALAIEDYLEEQKKRDYTIEQKLKKLNDESIILWGIGTRMMQTMAVNDIQGLNIVRCIDGNPARWNSTISFCGKEYVIESPVDLEDKISDDLIIVICCNSKQYEVEIKNTILQQGLKNRIIFL